MSLEVYDNREQWLLARGIGASAAPIILGLSHWGSPFSLWAEMTGLAPRDLDDSAGKPWLEWGLRLEAPIAIAFAEKTLREVTLRPRYSLERHDTHPWLTASPDADQMVNIDEQAAFAEVGELPELPLDPAVYETPGLLQIKTASAFKASEWKSGIPLYYQVQVQHELFVTQKEWATLCVLIDNSRFKVFPDIKRDDHFIKAMLPKLAAFQELVETQTEPPLDDSEATAQALARMYPRDNKDTIVLPDESTKWDERLVWIKNEIKGLTSEKTYVESKFKAAIGEAAYGLLPCGSRYSWKQQAGRAEKHCPKCSELITAAGDPFRVLRKGK